MARKIPIGILKNHRKHIVQHSLFTQAAAGRTNLGLINAVNVADVTATDPVLVREGCTVKAVHLEYWLTGDDVVQGSMIACLVKLPNSVSAPTAAEMANLDVYDNKNNILEIHQGLTNQKDGVAQPIFSGWYQIPSGKQRFALGDQLNVCFLAQSDGINGCGVTIYKEYY